MRVAVICEFSGIVRNAFNNLGHDAISFDLLPSEQPGEHRQGDIMEYPYDYWKKFDLAICHPPCTYLTYAATRYWNEPGRNFERIKAMDFFMYCINLPIERICVENPVGMPNVVYRKPDQIIHPYYFGDTFQKRTCLWLKNLQPLYFDRQKIEKPEPVYICQGSKKKGKPINFCEAAHCKDGLKRWQIRSRTSKKIAAAMAEQFSNFEQTQLCLNF